MVGLPKLFTEMGFDCSQLLVANQMTISITGQLDPIIGYFE